ncbi:MAG: S-layer homology domain-containing protein [Dialister sp.]|nr:S-layer homology domain-containing protein [Dialister sp.]MDY5544974.1 S-layer homology domain-containing protein [Dialister sp.]
MKHAFLKAAIAACFACAAVTVSAANPFTDVSADDWAYQAVASLSDEGVIDGYPDGTFRGDKHVTRYEIAQIVARLMAKEDTLNASQKETLAKLSSQYVNELKDLGVRIAELEKKRGATDLITELRVQSIDRYDDVFKGKKHNEISTRVRLNTITPVNDRVHLYGQIETILDMNGKESYDVNRIDPKDKSQTKPRTGYGDGDFHLNRLWTTYHFGPKQDTTNLPYGPSKNLIGIGQFPVKMGVTGYTYDGEVKGVFASFGDYLKGGRLTLAFGRATNINYAYTGPMMRGVKVSDIAKGKLLNELKTNKVVAEAVKAYPTTLGPILQEATEKITGSQSTQELMSNVNQIIEQIHGVKPELAGMIATKVASTSDALADLTSGKYGYYNTGNDTLYPMGRDVVMGWGDDEDVPVAYASYIYKKPGQWEAHAYAMKACGPVGHIAKAYGFAGSYHVTPMLRVQGEFVKNLRKLPLNNERPYSYNYGIHYGEANVLKAKSFSIGVDYVYSQAGTYFGGSSNDIVDQYTGHVYKNWNGMKMPAYFADKMDALTDGDQSNDNNNFGGAKFYLAKASFVPMRGLLVEANYGFNAKDMGGKKMDNMFMLKATAYIK